MGNDATIREARDIISRWSSSDLLDRITSLPPIPEFKRSESGAYEATGKTQSVAESAGQDSKPTSQATALLSSEIRPTSSSEKSDSSQKAKKTSATDREETAHHRQPPADEQAQDHTEEKSFDEAPQDDTDEILKQVDALAQKVNPDVERPPWLRLAEIEKPRVEDPYVNTSGLFVSSEPSEPLASDPSDQDPSEKDSSSGKTPPSRRDKQASRPEATAPSKPQKENSEHSSDSSDVPDLELITQPPQPETTEARPAEPAPRQQQAATPETAAEKVVSLPPWQKEGSQPKSTSRGPVTKTQKNSAVRKPAPTQQPPLLSALLKGAKAESVGQLAFADAIQRQSTDQRGTQSSENDQAATSEASGTKAQKVDAKSKSSSQLSTEQKQANKRAKSETDSVQQRRPANLNASDQSAPKTPDTQKTAAVAAESTSEQSIQREEATDVDGGTLPVTAEPKRAAVPRRAQQRKQHSRNLNGNPSEVVQTEAEQEGTNTVSRKYRVDNPNPEASTPSEQLQSAAAEPSSVRSNASTGGRRFRIDAAEDVEETLGTGDDRVRTQGRPQRRYIDEPHASAIRGPHFQVTSRKRSNVASLTGQFLAYLGVLGLTVGTAIVIYGHFGGVSEYTPTGWLVTTVAQMMLFLGVINLVSGGIEQNNEDVSTRINTLGEQLMRIEQVTEQALKGPKIPASRYADPNSVPEDSRTRQTVKVEK